MKVSAQENPESLRHCDWTKEDRRRVHESCYCGTRDQIIRVFDFVPGDIEGFIKRYGDLRNLYLTIDQPGFERNEIGPIEDKFFFFCGDTLRLNPPLVRDWFQVDDEWNAFQYIQTHGQEKLRRLQIKQSDFEILELWRRRAVPYQEAIARVAAMVISPRPSK